MQSVLVHWRQANPTIVSHADVLGGSSRAPAPLRRREKPYSRRESEGNEGTANDLERLRIRP